MADTDISLNFDAAAATAAQWREYADLVERHGATQHVAPQELRGLLGEIYAPYIDAKQTELDARMAAYQRVAANARRHADKLENTRQGFMNQDAESAQRIQNLI